MFKDATKAIAIILLSFMGVLGFLSYQGDSLTMDELSHIPAGYSYLSQRDFRINPEHPPLVKDLASFPLLFLDLNFPSQSQAWKEPVNGQWWYGWKFLFDSGNNADQIIFWARLPMVIMLIALGWFLFWWTKKEFGEKTALLTLFFFSFSPSFLAHGRLVTTDVAATLGFALGIYFWLRFLRNPSFKNTLISGLVFGFCMLLKFSLALLVPTVAIMTVAYALFNNKSLARYLFMSLIIGITGVVLVIIPVYLFHTSNYPIARQIRDTRDLLLSSPLHVLSQTCIWMADKPILRSLGHYFLGLLMATQRTAFGNTVYFMGMISGSGWWYYFPLVYFLKVPLAFHILTLLSLAFSFLFLIKKPFWVNTVSRVKKCIISHFTEFSLVIFLVIYWGTSVSGNLNIGVRHVLPTFPFIYMLVSWGLISALREIKKSVLKKTVKAFVVLLLFWYGVSSLASFPYYLSYFNEIGGGVDKGYQYVVDSNYDWGQDLKRLAQWIEKNNIEKIKVDYFGGADIKYYLGDKSEVLNPETGPQNGWLAISATMLQGGRGFPVPGYDQPSGYYRWLNSYQPVARAGKSIFIYHITEY